MSEIIENVKNFFIGVWGSFSSWVEGIAAKFSISPYIVYGALALALILVIVLICAICSKGKKKKVSKDKVEIKNEEVVINENEDSEEVKEEQPVVEEPKVEEVKEEQPVVEEPKVEEVKEEQPVEEVKEEKVEKVEKPKTVKKTTSKKAPAKKVKVEEPKVEEAKEEAQPSGEENKTLGKYTISQEGLNYRYRLIASNGELMAVSELYTSYESCKKGIETLKKNAVKECVDFVKDKHDLYSFRIMTKQGRCLATSANYKTEQRAISASESFIRFSATTKIVNDDTLDHFEIEEYKEEITPEENGKFVIVESEEGFSYQLHANNGRIIATSQNYAQKVSCLEALEKFRDLVYSGKFFIFKDKNSKYQYKLYNSQKRMMLAGEVYDSKINATNSIASIKRFAKLAVINDK